MLVCVETEVQRYARRVAARSGGATTRDQFPWLKAYKGPWWTTPRPGVYVLTGVIWLTLTVLRLTDASDRTPIWLVGLSGVLGVGQLLVAGLTWLWRRRQTRTP
jgi:hypothetical protein